MPVNSVALGVYGRLTSEDSGPHGDEDCYSVFHALSALQGWLSPMNGAGVPSLWGMNDAGGPWPGADEVGLRGWFQVGPESDGAAPLPIEPFTVAALSTLRRFGHLVVDGLEYYLPVGGSGSVTTRVQSGQNWFALAGPEARTAVRMTLDSGESTVVVDHAAEILRALGTIAPSEEGLDAALDDNAPAVDFADRVPWRWWLGDGDPHTVTLRATATEWSPLGIGRAVSLVTEACRSIGTSEAIGVRVVRVEDA